MGGILADEVRMGGTLADEVHMGGTLKVSPSDTVNLTASVKGVAGGKVEFMIDGKLNPALSRQIVSNDDTIAVKWAAVAGRHFIYIKVRDKEGKLALVGNPIYVEE